MSGKQIGPVLKAWYQWKALRLPWRKRFLVGLDLQGNTYWEFKLQRGDDTSGRFRRIVNYSRSTHYSEVKVPPQWHQWLRYQRERPPSLQEQSADVMRQERMKVLVAEADARWDAKPSLIDMPGKEKGQPVPPLNTGKTQPQEQAARAGGREQEVQDAVKPKENPWKRARGGPNETWQPAPWTPTSARKREVRGKLS
ncbi:Uu.00g061510.m01.CDS01 [Anthostomella pinea]|uniref:Uu.00g061510.m01.CDS01 n=1 Tax=Anthostomella pinea TaxID=933095 RepID=A0AAI8VSI2_9PEZI|nr:Uu.00g061510.m01.CDS01 [Anthostomella pinea]